jgi:membrane protein implicated in regulation of membrane protease activity
LYFELFGINDMQKKDTVKRYILFQIPEILITFLVLVVVRYFFEFPLWIVFAVTTGAIVKDVIMFHYTWTSYIVHSPEDYANVKGKQCIAMESFEKMGMVRINAELWKAQTAEPVKKNEELVVRKIDGLELFVEKKI